MASDFRPTGCLRQSRLSLLSFVPLWLVIFGLQGVSVKAVFHSFLWYPHGKSYSAYRVSQSNLTFLSSSGAPMGSHYRPTGCLSQSWLSSPPLVSPWLVIFGLPGVSVKADFHCLLWYPIGKPFSAYRVSQSKLTFITSTGLVPLWQAFLAYRVSQSKLTFIASSCNPMASNFRPTGCLSQSRLSLLSFVPLWLVIFGLQGVSVKADIHRLLWYPYGKPFSTYSVSQSELTFIASYGTPMASNFWPTGCLSQSWLSLLPLVSLGDVIFDLQCVPIIADFH